MQTTLRIFAVTALVALTAPILAVPDTITVDKHQEFRIVLSETPSTGYSWFMSVSGFNTRLLRLLKSKFVSGHGLGAPGERILRFRARKKGSTTLRLQYRGPGDQLGDTYTANVIIE